MKRNTKESFSDMVNSFKPGKHGKAPSGKPGKMVRKSENWKTQINFCISPTNSKIRTTLYSTNLGSIICLCYLQFRFYFAG